MDESIGKTANANRRVLIAVFLLDVYIAFTFFSATKKGNIATGLTILMMIMMGGCLLLNFIWYFRDRDSIHFKRVSLYGYCIVYCIALFSALNDYFFILLFPMAAFYVMYYDFKLMMRISIGVILINTLDIGLIYFQRGMMPSGLPLDIEFLVLRLVSILVFFLATCGIVAVTVKKNKENLACIRESQEQTTNLLKEVLGIAIKVKANSEEASELVFALNKGTSTIADAITDKT